MKATIDAALCQGHGRCYEIAPEVFSDDERSRGFVIAGELSPELLQSAQAAVNACPERAVALAPAEVRT